jgi:ribosome hibernation promoting factor
MYVQYTARHMELTDALRNYTQAKLEKMKRHMEMIVEAHIILSVEKYRHKAEVTLQGKRSTVSGFEVSGDMYQSIDGAFDKIEKQLRRQKDRRLAKRGNRGEDVIVSPDIDETFNSEIAIGASDIVKNEMGNKIAEIKEMDMKEMPIEEALMSFEGNEGNMFLFRDSDFVNVLYRRTDGKLCLIKAQ